MWIIGISLFLQIYFILLIVDVYYRNVGVQIYTNFAFPLKLASAKRVVLFLPSGLNADTLFGINQRVNDDDYPFLNYSNMSFLRNIIHNGAMWGTSTSTISSESYPDLGLLNILTGHKIFSESALGILPNIKYIDSLIKQVRHTWAWCTDDIEFVIPFDRTDRKKIHFASLKENSHLSGTQIDQSIKRKVINFFREEIYLENKDSDVLKDQLLFIIQFPGLSISTENAEKEKNIFPTVSTLDTIISELYNVIEDFYNNDGKTTYLLTSTRGSLKDDVNNVGTYVDNILPYVIWGAGINKSLNSFRNINEYQNYSMIQSRNDIYQNDICVLLAILLGTNIPKHSTGIFPSVLTGLNSIELMDAYRVNAQQLFTYYNSKVEYLIRYIRHSIFRQYSKDIEVQTGYAEINYQSFNNGKHAEVISVYVNYLLKIRAGIEYLDNYFKPIFLPCLYITLVFWSIYLLARIFKHNLNGIQLLQYQPECFCNHLQKHIIFINLCLIIYLMICGTIYGIVVSGMPYIYILYLIVPQILITLVFTTLPIYLKGIFVVLESSYITRIGFGIIIIVHFLMLNVMMVSFTRTFLYGVWIHLSSLLLIIIQNKKLPTLLLWRWFIGTLFLSIFPMADTLNLETDNEFILPVACFCWVCLSIYLTLNDSLYIKNDIYTGKKEILMYFQPSCISLALLIISLVNLGILDENSYFYVRCMSWLLSGTSILIPFYSSLVIEQRLYSILMGLIVPLLLLSNPFEMFFLLTLLHHMITWLQIENYVLITEYYENNSLNLIKTLVFEFNSVKQNLINDDDFREALYCLFYSFFVINENGKATRKIVHNADIIGNFLSVRYAEYAVIFYAMKTFLLITIVCCTCQAVITIRKTSMKKILYICILFCLVMSFYFIWAIENIRKKFFNGILVFDYVVYHSLVALIILGYCFAFIYTNFSFVNKCIT